MLISIIEEVKNYCTQCAATGSSNRNHRGIHESLSGDSGETFALHSPSEGSLGKKWGNGVPELGALTAAQERLRGGHCTGSDSRGPPRRGCSSGNGSTLSPRAAVVQGHRRTFEIAGVKMRFTSQRLRQYVERVVVDRSAAKEVETVATANPTSKGSNLKSLSQTATQHAAESIGAAILRKADEG